MRGEGAQRQSEVEVSKKGGVVGWLEDDGLGSMLKNAKPVRDASRRASLHLCASQDDDVSRLLFSASHKEILAEQ